jgi:hypothetical protein
MDSHEHVLLRALASAMHLAHTEELEANQVNEIAVLLQLPLEEVPSLVNRLQGERLVQLHWGGRVELTPEGRARAEGRTLSAASGAVQMGNVHVSEKAQVVINSPHAVTGPGAMGPGAMRVEMIDSLGDLTAALQALRHGQEGLTPEGKAIAQQLEGEVVAIVQEVQQRQPNRKSLSQRLDQATTLLGKLTSVAEAAQKLGPTLTLISSAFNSLRRWIIGE